MAIVDGLIISCAVSKGFRVITVAPFVLFVQIELAGVSGKPEIKLQFFHCIQGIGIILLDLGIGLGARQFPYHKIASMRNGLYSCTQDGLKLGRGMSFWAAERLPKKDRTAASSRVVKQKLDLFIRRKPRRNMAGIRKYN